MFSPLEKFKERKKIVLLRVDYNVDFNRKGMLLDDFRLRQTLPTVNYLEGLKSKIILATHLDRPKRYDKRLSTKRLIPFLERIFQKKIVFLDNFSQEEEETIKKRIEKYPFPTIFLLENLRFFKGEIERDKSFARQLSSLAEFYVFDAFSVCHRNHSSVTLLPKLLKTYQGKLLTQEVKNLRKVMENPAKPLTFILGGFKAETKLPLIERWQKIADYILIGGALATTFLVAQKKEVGKSIYEPFLIPKAREILKKGKIVLPVDFAVIRCQRKKNVEIENLRKNDLIQDIGKETIRNFSQIISQSKTIVWNGPMGCFEDKRFRNGTFSLAQAIVSAKAFSLVGGGETLLALKQSKVREKFSFLSTGGGAMLQFLSGKKMPCLEN